LVATERRELTKHDLVSRERNQRSAGHVIDQNKDTCFGLMCFQSTGELSSPYPVFTKNP
jgi:hypothetical protein